MKIKRDTKMIYVVVGVLVLAVGAGLLLGEKVAVPRLENVDYPENPVGVKRVLMVGEEELMVEVRDDDAGRSLGLSGRESLGESEGMLFVFEGKARPMFWMKDMRMDLDMIWIDEGQVMQVDEKVPAPTKDDPRLRTATPSMPVDSVLEVRGGWVAEKEVKVGDEVRWGEE